MRRAGISSLPRVLVMLFCLADVTNSFGQMGRKPEKLKDLRGSKQTRIQASGIVGESVSWHSLTQSFSYMLTEEEFDDSGRSKTKKTFFVTAGEDSPLEEEFDQKGRPAKGKKKKGTMAEPTQRGLGVPALIENAYDDRDNLTETKACTTDPCDAAEGLVVMIRNAYDGEDDVTETIYELSSDLLGGVSDSILPVPDRVVNVYGRDGFGKCLDEVKTFRGDAVVSHTLIRYDEDTGNRQEEVTCDGLCNGNIDTATNISARDLYDYAEDSDGKRIIVTKTTSDRNGRPLAELETVYQDGKMMSTDSRVLTHPDAAIRPSSKTTLTYDDNGNRCEVVGERNGRMVAVVRHSYKYRGNRRNACPPSNVPAEAKRAVDLSIPEQDPEQ